LKVPPNGFFVKPNMVVDIKITQGCDDLIILFLTVLDN
jgi:hypothetical protein